MTLIPTLRKENQKLWEFQASQGYVSKSVTYMDVTQRGKERKKAKNRKQSLRRGQGWGLETKKTRASEALKEVLPLGIPPPNHCAY